MKTEITITPADIARGKPASRFSCPVALALSRVTGRDWIVYQTWARCWDAGIDLPKKVRRFIRDFDNRKTVQPLTWEADLD